MIETEFDRKLKDAREMFNIDCFPGDLFSYITQSPDYIDNYKLVIFKEDLDKLHGFVAYEGDYVYIGINHKRPIGLQNFTLAHELGHYFLHSGKNFTDDNIESAYQDSEEKEAFSFGMELLYPSECFKDDFEHMVSKSLFDKVNAEPLGLFINDLCHKYYMSFPVILHRHLYKAYKVKEKKDYERSINSALGKKYTELDKNFYIANGSTYDCPSILPYLYLKGQVETAVHAKKISKPTGEAIMFPYRNREGMQ